MSFGFGVGDFIAVGELCWKIYTRVYKVSRDAPEELRALIQELGNLSNTVNLLNEELRDQEEWLKRAGERRLEYTCKVMSQAKETLQKMDRLADKYVELGTGGGLEGSRRSFRIHWNRVKYALEVSSINELLHVSQFPLNPSFASSSLERIEKQQSNTDMKLDELRNLMIGDRSSRENPLLNGPLEEEVRAELSAAFLRSAETGNRPWASIGIDDWLQAGASNDRRNEDIRKLSQTARKSLESFPRFDFQLHDIEDYTMNIWLQEAPSGIIAPRQQPNLTGSNHSWQTSNGEILFQCFVEICNTTKSTKNLPDECFLTLEVPHEGIFLNFTLQNFAGQTVSELQVKPADEYFDFQSLYFEPWVEFKGSEKKSLVRLLNDQGYDIGCTSQSDSPTLLLRTIILDLAEKGCEKNISGSKFLAQDLSVELPPGYRDWKVICWHCEKFEDIKPLFKKFHVRNDVHRYLIQTAFLRLNRSLLSQLACYMNYGDTWRPDDVLIMVEAALSSEDAGYLLWVLDNVASSVISRHRVAILRLVYNSRALNHIETMLQRFNPRPADIAATISWYLVSNDEQSFEGFLQLIEDCGGSFSSRAAEDVDFTDFYPTFVSGCSHLIERKCSNSLSLYLSSFERLGINFHGVQGHETTDSSQLAILPALVSPDPSFLRILLERDVAGVDMEPFVVEYNSWNVAKCPPRLELRELVQYPSLSMPHWPLYCAVMLVCDTEFLHLLCQHGASLQQKREGTQDQKTETQGITHHLSSLSSVSDARLEYMEALMICHVLICVGTLGRHFPSRPANYFRAVDEMTDYEETWNCMERLLYRDSFFSDCLCPCGYAFQGDWKRRPDTRSKLMSRYSEFPQHYSRHLRTQATWDTWRRDALEILNM
ncbi:hypothetical protein FGLOB1_3892 [Fusarium globosum]|uniref:Uncharacterized protein n=1 Tax=Fusarium globosum TaxID=78864 RepID=A0A8H5YKC6_9HYPO|nr:hypothetical protein FGLOB1_3892 [Fusarium globosum]